MRKSTRAAVKNWPQISLAPVEAEDLPIIHKWQNTPAIREQIMGFRFPIQMESTEEWYKAVRESNSKNRVVFTIKESKKTIGIIQLTSIDWVHRKAMLGIYLDDEVQQKGIGHIACSILIDYAFNGLNLEKIGLEVLSGHSRAKNLYKKLNFQLEGTKRKEFYLNAKREDVDIYGLLVPDWKSISPLANRLIFSPTIK